MGFEIYVSGPEQLEDSLETNERLLIKAHATDTEGRLFQDLVEDLGLPGMPHVLRRRTVVDTYHRMSGYAPQDMDFFTAYAALRHGIVMFRIARRQATFGESEMPEDPDHAILHHANLRRMIEGTYWGDVRG